MTVYQPLVDQALARIEANAHALLVPAGAQPTTIKGLSVGSQVTVTMSPAVSGVVLDQRVNPKTQQPELLVLTRDKGIVVASPEDVTPGLLPTSGTENSGVPSSSAPEAREAAPAAAALSHSIHVGDLVQTSMGIGRVVREANPGSDLYDVDLGPSGKFTLSRKDLSVVPPPAPPAA